MRLRFYSSDRLSSSIEAQDLWSAARAASFRTSHGVVGTPNFMPVAARAALRSVDATLAEVMSFQVLLANTYHLLLRPGPAVFEKLGDIHRFMQ